MAGASQPGAQSQQGDPGRLSKALQVPPDHRRPSRLILRPDGEAVPHFVPIERAPVFPRSLLKCPVSATQENVGCLHVSGVLVRRRKQRGAKARVRARVGSQPRRA